MNPIAELNRMNRTTSRPLRATKAYRVLRRWPAASWKEFKSPLTDRTQILALTNAFVATYLILQTASFARMVEEANSWALAIQAFGITSLVWAVLAMARAPLIVRKEDRLRGRWHKNHFVYHEPILITTERFEAGEGLTLKRPIYFSDAEPCAMVYYRCELTPDPSPRVTVYITGGHPNEDMELTEPGNVNWGRFVGIRLPHDCAATLLMRMLPETVPVICRVYCHSFFVGKDSDTYVR